MNNDWPPYKCRPLNVVMELWRTNKWIPREEEEMVHRFSRSVAAIHSADKRRKKAKRPAGAKRGKE